MSQRLFRINFRKRQAGLTLIELMIAIVLGMLLVAAIATLIANQSANRNEVDRSGKMIENGRYALSAMALDLQMAGYWGEFTENLDVSTMASLPNPCDVTVDPPNKVPDLNKAMGLAVQGYNSPGSLPSGLACVGNTYKPGTDILVVRRVDPDISTTEAGGIVNWANLTPGHVYVQTGLDDEGNLKYSTALAVADETANKAIFNLTRRRPPGAPPLSPAPAASLRRYMVHIYYISQCSVEASGSCVDDIPTLKRVELRRSGANPTMSCPDCKVTIAEGIDDMQIHYGTDSDPTKGTPGAPDGVDTNGSGFANATDWANVMSMKIYLLARSAEQTPGHKDTKKYVLGTKLPDDEVDPFNDAYKRHVFTQSVRLVNPSVRRMH